MWKNQDILSPQDAQDFLENSPKPCAVFYSQFGLLDAAHSQKLDFVTHLTSLFNAADIDCLLVNADNFDGPTEIRKNDYCIWMVERPPTIAHRPNQFHVFPAYLHGFWYCDPKGLRNNSSISDATFKPHKMSGQWARKVFERLNKKFVGTGRTKFEQPPANTHPPPNGCIAIPVQTFVKPTFYKTWIQYPELIKETLRTRGNRPVAIKPHPGLGLKDSTFIASLHDPENGVFVEPFNLHELLAAADCVVTRCSAVAIEAALHKTPAIVTGEVDFHHITSPVKTLSEIGPAIHAALGQHRPYEKYLTWFFTQQLFQPQNNSQTANRLVELLALPPNRK